MEKFFFLMLIWIELLVLTARECVCVYVLFWLPNMISNHNQNMSSFRIIEPRPFQQAQQVQIPIHAVAAAATTLVSSSTPQSPPPPLPPPPPPSSTFLAANMNTSTTTTTTTTSGGGSMSTFNSSQIDQQQQQHQQNSTLNVQQSSSASITNSLSHHHLYQNGGGSSSMNGIVQHAYHMQTPTRVRNLSDTDSSCIPGRIAFITLKASYFYYLFLQDLII